MCCELYKECELRRFGPEGRVERAVRWLCGEQAFVGRRVDLDDGGEPWEVVSAPDPALPASLIRRFDPDGIAVAVG